jgi:hypothetical protein
MIWRHISIALVACVSCSTIANAQVTGSRTAPKPAEIPDSAKAAVQQARQTTLQFVACTMQRDRLGVLNFLATFPGSPEARKMIPSLMRDDCLSVGEMKFYESLYRWDAYDLLYRQSFGRSGPVDFSAASPFASPIDLDKATAEARETVALAEMGDCVVRKSPAEARQLALSPVTTEAEVTAFNALMPSISACVPQNSTLTFSKNVLRGIVVQALYTLSSGQSGTVAKP